MRFASTRKPAWLGEGAPVFNAQSNVYVVSGAMIGSAVEAASR